MNAVFRWKMAVLIVVWWRLNIIVCSAFAEKHIRNQTRGINNMMSDGLFVAGLKCSGNVFLGIQFICMAKRDLALNCNLSDHSS